MDYRHFMSTRRRNLWLSAWIQLHLTGFSLPQPAIVDSPFLIGISCNGLLIHVPEAID